MTLGANRFRSSASDALEVGGRMARAAVRTEITLVGICMAFAALAPTHGKR
jgi:hypothetical protein